MTIGRHDGAIKGSCDVLELAVSHDPVHCGPRHRTIPARTPREGAPVRGNLPASAVSVGEQNRRGAGHHHVVGVAVAAQPDIARHLARGVVDGVDLTARHQPVAGEHVAQEPDAE